MWITPVTLTGPFTRLEPLEVRHAAGLLSAADPELFRHTPQNPQEWTAAGFAEGILKVTGLADVVAFAIVDSASGAVLGRTTFMDIRAGDRGVEIGRTWITRPRHGTHVNPEIKYLMLRHAFEALTPTAIRVQLTTGITNLHSQAAIAKLGAMREGVLRHNRILPDGVPRDSVFYSILAAEWTNVKDRLEQRFATRHIARNARV
ncbi:GNAT family protein [soil metagenome]